MKRIISLILVLAMPFLMACGSTKTVAAAASAEVPAAESQASGHARWTPPAESASVPAAPAAQPAEQQAAVPAPEAQTDVEEQPFPDVGVPSSQVLEILGKPDRSELGQNSNHKYFNREYQGIVFESIEVDMTSDGTVWLINLVADEATDKDLLMTFMQNWADALQQAHGAPAVSRFDNKTTYDWQDISLDISRYPEVNILDYHIGLFWKQY